MLEKKGLGRGLGALLGDVNLSVVEDVIGVSDTNTSKDTNVDIDLLYPSSFQPRKDFDDDSMKALIVSVKEKGVLQPLLVRKRGDKFEIIAGERRWRAAQEAGLRRVPVIIKDFSDKEVLEVALVENLLRENLNPIEEAEGFVRLIEEFSHTQEALSQIVGKSRSYVANALRLLNLPEEVKQLVSDKKISAGHARTLVGAKDPLKLAYKIVEQDLSVRQVENIVAKQKSIVGNKPRLAKDEDIEQIEKDLKDALGLRIAVTPNKKGGGKVVLQYASVAELDMIINILEQKQTPLAPKVATQSQPEVTEDGFTIDFID